MGVLLKVRVLNQIEILEDGSMQVRHATYVTEDGVRISDGKYERTAFVPGSDLPFDADDRVKAVASAVWTPEVIDAYKKKIEAQVLPAAPARVRTPVP